MPELLGMIASSLIGGGMNLIGQKSQLNAQKEENNRVFEQNKELAKLQNEYNIAQWNRENEYNTPSNQMKRLKEAGINPDMFYSGGTSGLTSASSPSMSAGSPNTPVDLTMNGNRSTIGDIVQSGLNTALQRAQIRNLNSNSDNSEEDTRGKEIDNLYKPQMYEANLREVLSRINVNDKTADNIVKSTQKLGFEMNHISASIDSIRNSIKNDNERLALQKIESELHRTFNTQAIKESMSRVGLNNQQSSSIRNKLSLELLNLSKNAELTDAQISESIARTSLTLLQQEGVLNQNARIALENMILTPQALKAEQWSELFKDTNLGTLGITLSNSLDLLYQFIGAIGSIIPR